MRQWIPLMVFSIFFSAGVTTATATPIEILDASGNKVYWQGPEEVFRTFKLTAQVNYPVVVVTVWTNYPPDLMPADLFFKKNGRIILAVKLGDGRILEHPAEVLTSQFLEPEELASRYVDGSYIPVQARRGTILPQRAVTEWREINSDEGRYLIRVEIPCQAFREAGKYEAE